MTAIPLSLLRGGANRARVEAAIRTAARAVPLGDAVVARTLGRHKLLVDAGDLLHAPHLLLDGYWRLWVTRWIAAELRADEAFVDGGAGYGYFTLLAAELTRAPVTAVEPHPRTAALLRRSLLLNGAGRVRVLEAALGAAASGPCHLHAAADDPLGAVTSAEPEAASRAVPTLTAADLIPMSGAVLIKLDLNGGERAAWAGLRAALRPGVRVLFSFDPAHGPDPAGLIAELAAAAPLRAIDAGSRARSTTPAALLAGGAATLLVAP